jgi:hypothetical protein
MDKFGKQNYLTKIALVYLCLCQIFSQINNLNFGLNFAQNGQNEPKMAKFGKTIISLKSH